MIRLSFRKKTIRLVILLGFLGATVTLWFQREPLQDRLIANAILSNDSPPPDVVRDAILRSGNPRAALIAVWNSRKIVHREAAIRSLPEIFPSSRPLPPEFDAVLSSAALDPDMDVREAAFAIFRDRKDPRLAALAAAQLQDPDSQVRLLGLNQIGYASPEVGVPTVIPSLDDENPLIVATTLHLLENWSGKKFGARLSDAVAGSGEESDQNPGVTSANQKIVAAVHAAKAWWAQHQIDFPEAHLDMPTISNPGLLDLPAGDFQLRGLDGTKTRLSDFRGRIVLINFWTTWCTACVSEIPRLVALQERHKGQVAILGICLDGVPDEDGENIKHGPEESTSLHDQILRTVKARGINYPVLMDEHNVVGGRFNGGELPTTVLVDEQGNIRRRFVGARTLAEFEAMLAGIEQNHR
jgi:thiol-disulfide isomerase/thioredoxin